MSTPSQDETVKLLSMRILHQLLASIALGILLVQSDVF